MRQSTLLPLLLSLTATSVFAINEAQLDAIRDLGSLNGIALHCGYIDETQRMKEALVAALPKRRELGLAFDESTNDSFLAFIEQGLSCPDSQFFNEQVETAIERLKAAF